jgi:hypothetical protein
MLLIHKNALLGKFVSTKEINRISIFIDFIKKTLFKGRIMSKSTEGLKENFDAWAGMIKE